MIEQVRKGVQKPSDVGDDDGLRVLAELVPGQLLDEFLEGADAAGKATKASDFSNMSCLRSCILAVT